MIWYPEIAGVLSPHILADLFFDCLLDRQVIPGRLEHASSIGMALASVLSVHLSMEPQNQALREFCKRISDNVTQVSRSEPTFSLVVAVLDFTTTSHPRFGVYPGSVLSDNIPDNLSAVRKIWLYSRRFGGGGMLGILLPPSIGWSQSTRNCLQMAVKPLSLSKRTDSSSWQSLWDPELIFVNYTPPMTSVWSSPIILMEFAHE